MLKNKINKKKILTLIIGAFSILILSICGTYAYVTIIKTGFENSISVGQLDLIFNEDGENNVINLTYDDVVTKEVALASPSKYSFYIENNNEQELKYTIYLHDVATYYQENDKVLNEKYVSFGIKRNNIDIVPSNVQDASNILDSGTINAGERINYELRLWVDKTSLISLTDQENVSNAIFASKVSVFASQNILAYTDSSCFTTSNNNINGYTCDYNEVSIPTTINDITINTLSDNTFTNKNLIKALIPSGITTIGNNTFASNRITSILLPYTIVTIGNNAFDNNLLSNITLPEGLTTIGNNAFNNNTLTNITIPSTVTTIGDLAFKPKTNNNISYIINKTGRDFAWQNILGGDSYQALTASTTINNNLTINNTFITGTVTINGNITYIISPSDCYTTNGNTITKYKCYEGNSYNMPTILDVNIPSSISGTTITTIGTQAFVTSINNNTMNINSVVMPNTITQINSMAFYSNNILSIVLSKNLTTLQDYAFRYNKLTKVTLPKSSGDFHNASYAFANNEITSINIPNGITRLGTLMFAHNKISNLNIPSTLIDMPGSFNDNLVSGSDAFIYKRNSDGTINNNIIVSYAGNNREITLPNNVVSIYPSAFHSTYLTSITLNEGLTELSENALSDNSFATLTIPSTVTIIMENAIDQSLMSNHNAVTNIINLTNRDFNWRNILNGSDYTAMTSSSAIIDGKTSDNRFITGTVSKNYTGLITTITAS